MMFRFAFSERLRYRLKWEFCTPPPTFVICRPQNPSESCFLTAFTRLTDKVDFMIEATAATITGLREVVFSAGGLNSPGSSEVDRQKPQKHC